MVMRKFRALWIGFASVMVAVGCSSGSKLADHPEYGHVHKEVYAVIDEVRTAKGTDLYNHLQRLVAYDMFAVEPVLDELAEDPNPRLRSNAMWVLAQINDPEFPVLNAKIQQALEEGLEDGDRLVRYEAASALLTRNDWTVVPVLLEGLSDSEAMVRYNCHESLKSVTSQDFGYTVDSPEPERVAAISRWESWYQDWQRSMQ